MKFRKESVFQLPCFMLFRPRKPGLGGRLTVLHQKSKSTINTAGGWTEPEAPAPADAVDAGTVCQNALGGYDQAIMGILQINQDEENAAKKYITNVIKGSIDRRVLFDNAVIFAIITKNRLGTPPSNCTDWPDDAVREAAEKHYGSCGDNYCTNILKYYKQYK